MARHYGILGTVRSKFNPGREVNFSCLAIIFLVCRSVDLANPIAIPSCWNRPISSEIPAALSIPVAAHQAWLRQRVWAGFAPGWRWRWIVIHRRQLLVYRSPDCLSPSSMIDLDRARLCDAGCVSGSSAALCIADCGRQGSVTLAAESDEASEFSISMMVPGLERIL